MIAVTAAMKQRVDRTTILRWEALQPAAHLSIMLRAKHGKEVKLLAKRGK